MSEVVWCKPYNPELHTGAVGAGGVCTWHGERRHSQRCPEAPYASVKIRDASGRESIWSACPAALRLISDQYGFPIPSDDHN
ncbi:hypothetical protein [Flindersiella endophytica]